jgi:hypothetical protein
VYWWAISHPSFEEKGEGFENGKGLFMASSLPSTLTGSPITNFSIDKVKIANIIYESKIKIKNMYLA